MPRFCGLEAVLLRIWMLALAGLLALGCAGAAAPEVDPHQAAADWFEDNRDYVAASVIAEILGSNPALAVIEVEYLKDQYRASVRTELRDVERVELGGEPVFTAVLWTLAAFEVDTENISGSVAVDFPWGMVIQADDGTVEATPRIGDMDLRVSVEGVSVEVEGIPVDEAKEKLEGLLGK